MLNDRQLIHTMYDKRGIKEWELFNRVFKADYWRRLQEFRASGKLPPEVRAFCERSLGRQD